MEHAKAWYNDPAYAPMIKLRQSGSIAELVLVEGLWGSLREEFTLRGGVVTAVYCKTCMRPRG